MSTSLADSNSPAAATSEAIDKTPFFSDGTEQVLVEFDVETKPESDLSGWFELVDQRRRISMAIDEAQRALPTEETTYNGALHTAPVAAFEVTPDGLDAIEDLRGVRSVVIDIPAIPLLDDAHSIVDADVLHAHDPALRGEGRAIAILDTGVDRNHPFFQGAEGSRIVSEACYSTNASKVQSLCPDGTTSSTVTGSGQDCDTGIRGCGHGTHVAGIAAGGEATVSGRLIRGVAPKADIIAIQVFSHIISRNEVMSYSFDQLKGLERVRTLKAAHDIAAVNMSLGTATTYQSECNSAVSRAYRTIVRDLFETGTPVVIASGNGGSSNGISSPACVNSAVAVGATDKSGRIASFTNTHPTLLDVYAPGVSTLSAVINDSGGTRSYGYGYRSGTSMAAPVVAGAFALLQQFNPDQSSASILSEMKSQGIATSRRSNGGDLGFSHPEIRLAASAGIVNVPSTSPTTAPPTTAPPTTAPPTTAPPTTAPDPRQFTIDRPATVSSQTTATRGSSLRLSPS